MVGRSLRVAVFWAALVGGIGALAMVAMRFHARDFLDLLPFLPLAAVMGALYVPIHSSLSKRLPRWPGFAVRFLAGTLLGLALGIVASLTWRYLLLSAGGIKGQGPHPGILPYLWPILFVLPPCLFLALVTRDAPRRGA